MKIKDIKDKILNEMQELKKELPEKIEKEHIGVQKFLVDYDGFEIISKKIYEDELEGHIIVNVFVEGYRASYYNTLPTGSKKIFDKMVKYWQQYAEHKGFKGVIFALYPGDAKFEEFYIDGNLTNEEREVLDYYLKREGAFAFYGAYISDELKEQIAKFLHFKSVIDKILQDEPLLSFDLFGSNTLEMYRGRSCFKYVGEKFLLEPIDDYSRLEIRFMNGEGKNINTSLNEKEIKNILEDIKISNRMKNEINVPKDNFLQCVKRLNRLENEEAVNREFDKLCDILGNWEKVEAEFVEMSEPGYDVWVEIEDKVTDKSITVYKEETKQYDYYFVNYRRYQNEIREKEFEIHIGEKGDTSKIKEVISKKMLEHL